MVANPFKTSGFVVFSASPCDDAHIQQAIKYCETQGFTNETAKIVKLENSVVVKIK